MPTMLWKYGALRIPPFHQVSKRVRLIAPTFPSASNRAVMASPTAWIPRITGAGMFGFIGSSKGGTKMRAGNGAVWWWL
jgi:hypothetical protein